MLENMGKIAFPAHCWRRIFLRVSRPDNDQNGRASL